MMRIILSIFAAVVGLAVAVDGFLIEPYRIEVTHSSVQAPLSRPLKIAHLTDLHTSGLGRRERKLLLLLAAERPDVIVITGDTVTRGQRYNGIRPLLSRLHAPRGVWLVRGNWENNRLPRDERTFYSQLGIHFLLNEASPIRPDVWIAGLDDPSTGTPDLDTAVKTVPQGAFRLATKVGEIAAAAAGDEDFLADAVRVFEDSDAAAALSGFDGAQQSRCAATKNKHIEFAIHGWNGDGRCLIFQVIFGAANFLLVISISRDLDGLPGSAMWSFKVTTALDPSSSS
jgi:hypothetical protein